MCPQASYACSRFLWAVLSGLLAPDSRFSCGCLSCCFVLSRDAPSPVGTGGSGDTSCALRLLRLIPAGSLSPCCLIIFDYFLFIVDIFVFVHSDDVNIDVSVGGIHSKSTHL